MSIATCQTRIPWISTGHNLDHRQIGSHGSPAQNLPTFRHKPSCSLSCPITIQNCEFRISLAGRWFPASRAWPPASMSPESVRNETLLQNHVHWPQDQFVHAAAELSFDLGIAEARRKTQEGLRVQVAEKATPLGSRWEASASPHRRTTTSTQQFFVQESVRIENCNSVLRTQNPDYQAAAHPKLWVAWCIIRSGEEDCRVVLTSDELS